MASGIAITTAADTPQQSHLYLLATSFHLHCHFYLLAYLYLLDSTVQHPDSHIYSYLAALPRVTLLHPTTATFLASVDQQLQA
jgi:hypothetical protein